MENVMFLTFKIIIRVIHNGGGLDYFSFHEITSINLIIIIKYVTMG